MFGPRRTEIELGIFRVYCGAVAIIFWSGLLRRSEFLPGSECARCPTREIVRLVVGTPGACWLPPDR
jgi:hypothetical protein